MTHYRMLDRAPSCAILHNRNELKVYQGNQVYLNNGDNFELRFFNPLPEKIGIEINFNGIKKGDGYLVLNPGQDLILDRFLDEQRKMLFETYVIDGNNEEAVKAIEENGLISFNFYKEKSSYRNYQKEVNVNYNFPPKPYKPPISTTTTTTTTTWYNGNISGASGTSGNSGSSGTSGRSGTSGLSGLHGTFGTLNTANLNSRIYNRPGIFTTEVDQSIYLGQNFQGPSSSIPIQQDYYFPTSSSSDINYSEYLAESLESPIDYSEYLSQSMNPVETGRIERGEVSDQKLKGVNLQFQPTPFHSINYKILPISSMNRTVKEVREYCPECGYRLRKSSWKYCPHCGEKIN